MVHSYPLGIIQLSVCYINYSANQDYRTKLLKCTIADLLGIGNVDDLGD